MKKNKQKCQAESCSCHDIQYKEVESTEELTINPKKIADYLGWKLTRKNYPAGVDTSVISRKKFPRAHLLLKEFTDGTKFIYVVTERTSVEINAGATIKNLKKVKFSKVWVTKNGQFVKESKRVELITQKGVSLRLADDEPAGFWADDI